jgi:cell division protein FtsW
MDSIHFAVLQIQPAEIAKLALICWLAHSLAKKRARIATFSIGFLPHALCASLLIGLCLARRDPGSALMLALIACVMMLAGRVRGRYVVGSGALAIAALAALISQFPSSRGDTPFVQGDIIAATVAGRLGFLGVAWMVLTFILIVRRGMQIAAHAGRGYGTLLSVGLTTFIGLQALMHLGVVVRLLPSEGLALPFLGCGDNALLVHCAAVGLLLNVSRQTHPAIARDAASRPTENAGDGLPTPALAASAASA